MTGILACLCLCGAARANVTYTYAGQPFSYNGSIYALTGVQGSFTLAYPLAPSKTTTLTPYTVGGTILSLNFTDGETTWDVANYLQVSGSGMNGSQFSVTTDANGRITAWFLNIMTPGNGGNTVITTCTTCSSGGAYDDTSVANNYDGYNFNHAGTWAASTAVLVGSAAGASSCVLTYSGAWTATANSSFLHVPAGSASGTGNAVVAFTYDAFTGTGTRMGTLTIAGITVNVTQAGTNYLGPGPAITVAPASQALSAPLGIAVDGAGNLYVSNQDNTVNEWHAATQLATTLVPSGFTGLNQPWGVAVDGSGNVYIADTFNNAIKEWNVSAQQLTTLVSSGLNTPYGVAVDGAGNVYIADFGNNAIKEWSATTQQVTTLVSSGLVSPSGVAVDSSGNVYIADQGHSAIKEWSVSTHQVTTLVSAGLSIPNAVAVDGAGNVYIADTNNEAIKEWSVSTQQVTTLASSGLSYTYGVAVDGSGNVYIAHAGTGAITEIPYAFVGAASLTEPAAAGSDSLLPVLPSTESLSGIFAPASDQSWLTIGTIATGVVNFSFTANTSVARVAHIALLGQQITVTQSGAVGAQTIIFGALANQPLGSAPFTISATASSGLAVTFASTTTSVCTVSGSTVTLVAVGTCSITASQAGNGTYSAAPTVMQSFSVQPTGTTPLTITTNATLMEGFTGGGYTQLLAAFGGSLGVYTWTVAAGALPAGLGLVGSAITGIPETAGTFSFTIKVTDSVGDAASLACSLTVLSVNAPLTRVGVISQFAAGAGWDTSIWIVNTSASAVPVRLILHGDDGTTVLKDANGNITSTPLTVSQQGNVEYGFTASSLDRVLNPNTGLIVGCGLNQAVNVEGWIDVLSTAADINGFAVFRYAPNGLTPTGNGYTTPWEGTVPLQTQITAATANTMMLPFDNTSGFNNGVAIGTLGTSATAIAATFYDINGNALGTPQTINLAATGHTSFLLYSQYPFTANKQGSVVFTSAQPIIGLGLRASPYGTLTSVPTILQ